MSLFDSALASSATAPYWFVEFFKTLGFALHLIPTGILLVGIPFSILLFVFGGVNAKRTAQRFFQQVPIFMALGINFALVPLLFVQTAYAKLFYTTTILVAAHWLTILPIAFVAYLLCYLCASLARKEKIWTTSFFACIASACFLVIGLIFSDVWTIFERPYEFESLRANSALSFSVLGKVVSLGASGTASGLGFYWNDPIIFIRFATICGLAFYAYGFWLIFDAHYLYCGPRQLTEEEMLLLIELEEETDGDGASKKVNKSRKRRPIQEDEQRYPDWCSSFACFIMIVGFLTAIPSLYELIFRRLGDVAKVAPTFRWNAALWGTFAATVLPLFFLSLGKLFKWSGKTLAFLTTLIELALVGFYATLRQTIQNVQLSPYFQPRVSIGNANDVQWTPILAFLGTFVLVVVWIFILITLAAKSGSTKEKRRATKTKAQKKNKKEKESDESSSRSPSEKKVSSSKDSHGISLGQTVSSGAAAGQSSRKSSLPPHNKGMRRL